MRAAFVANPATGYLVTYTYDAQGRRKSKASNGSSTIYVTDSDNRAVLEYNGGVIAQVQRWYAFGLGPDEPLNHVDPTGLATLQLGGAGSINLPFGVTIPLGFGVAIDTQGHVGLYSYAGGGAQVGAEVEAGVSVQVSNAKTISDLTGPFFNVSGHAGAGVGGSVDYFTGSSANGPVAGGGVTLGAAAGASVSGGVTNTWLYAPFGSGATPSNPSAPTPGPTSMQPSPTSIAPVSTSPGSSLSGLGTSSSLPSK